MLGDHGLLGKLGYWEQSYAIPCIVRDPGARRRTARSSTFTENVDVMPTICALTGVDVPAQCDGRSLVPFLDGRSPDDWRDAAHWEFDWRTCRSAPGSPGRKWTGRSPSSTSPSCATPRTCTSSSATVSGCAATSPPIRRAHPHTDPAVVLPLAQRMLVWRTPRRTHAHDMLCEHGGSAAGLSMPTGCAPAPRTPDVLFATVLALGSAVLHAGWNLIAKRSADPFLRGVSSCSPAAHRYRRVDRRRRRAASGRCRCDRHVGRP